MTWSHSLPRPLSLSATLLLLTLVLGIVVRFAPVGLPWVVQKYGGSVLWAAMIYWVCTTLAPRLHPGRAALAAQGIATAVEYLKLVHTPELERFRGTLAGVLLLGRQFSYADILAYTTAIVGAAAIDQRLRKW